ncbi:MAG: AAA family ATPase [Actinomycetota bacterium]|nr:AAA family ATPase [Actinomycetota bacterium]
MTEYSRDHTDNDHMTRLPMHDSNSGSASNGHAPAGVLMTLADVTPERVSWLWPGRLPAGKLVTLDGDPGLGKSTVGITFCAHVSTGRTWPDGTPCPTGDAVILSAEDGMADTIRPRLDAAEGDPARVHCLTAVRHVTEDGESVARPPTLADMAAIREVIERTGARLLVVDVLMAYMPGKVDSHRDQDVRAVLHRLTEVAEQTGCTVLLLRHLNKSNGGSPIYRGGGSIGIVGAARAGYVIAPDPDDDTQRVLATVKNNLAPEAPSITYRLENTETGAARVVWGEASEHQAADLLRPAESDDDRSERDEAGEWLIDYLNEHGGEAPAGEVIGAAMKAGLAKHSVQRARKRAGVESRKSSMGGGWVWAIAIEGDAKVTKVTGHRERSPSSPSVSPSEEEPSAEADERVMASALRLVRDELGGELVAASGTGR